MLPDLIKLFNCVAVKPGEHLFNPEMVNNIAARCGYLVHPAACTQDVLKFLEPLVSNYNSTFYKDWKQVDSLSEAEMCILQMVHYLSTYGSDYQGTTFTMNDFPEEMRYGRFEILMPVSERELFDRILTLLGSGVALSDSTVSLILEQALVYSRRYAWPIDPLAIKNREARAKYYIEAQVYPDDPFELMRIILYVATGKAVIINDRSTQQLIARNIRQIIEVVNYLSDERIDALARVFYRYKKLFLIMRLHARAFDNDAARTFVTKINRIRRLAPKMHRPFRTPVIQRIMDSDVCLTDAIQAIDNQDNTFLLVRLLNYLASLGEDASLRTFIIRSGAVWVKTELKKQPVDFERVERLRSAILARLASILKPSEPKTVRFPRHLELAAPVSEKQFVGPIPYGSKFRMKANNYIGVYWRNEWGTHDFDLWVVINGNERIGWNDAHKKDNILFSGDMTDADPEATEIMLCRGRWPDSTVRVVRYNGTPGSRFRIFFGADDIKELPRNRMVNPDTIMLEQDLISESRETTVGVVHDNTAYFTSLRTGQLRVPSASGTISFEEAFAARFNSFISLKTILLAAGFKEYVEDGISMPDIDLAATISKDTIISLMTPQ